MRQSRTISVIESLVNIFLGMGVALASQYVIFPLVGIQNVSHSVHLQITFYFTMVSFVRSYFVRRYFETHLRRIATRVAGAGERIKGWMTRSA